MKIMGFGSSLFKGIHFGERCKSRRSKVVESSTITTTYVCRDELDKKKPKIKKQVKFDLEPKYHPSEEEISHEEENKNNSNLGKTRVQEGANHANYDGIKVKILMKKEDATRLLLKYREEGALEFMDVAQQLVQVPSTSVRVLSSPNHR
ncbi:hypothetical protein RND71_016849 [Anisodus tanguticus]|uniref:DUF7890 domain-containing protein n=1 Tax=Anisodus tanguticus TaxID=243964 RepID=A0AAE1S950_9SOLA|nr:hypothetical protein RND71_016849 [Anisodus tanguticus]